LRLDRRLSKTCTLPRDCCNSTNALKALLLYNHVRLCRQLCEDPLLQTRDYVQALLTHEESFNRLLLNGDADITKGPIEELNNFLKLVATREEERLQQASRNKEQPEVKW